jgi:hypothetical protein
LTPEVLRINKTVMNDFPLPQEQTPRQAALEDGVIRWAVVMLPILIIGKIMGLLAIVAILIAANYNILSWIE